MPASQVREGCRRCMGALTRGAAITKRSCACAAVLAAISRVDGWETSESLDGAPQRHALQRVRLTPSRRSALRIKRATVPYVRITMVQKQPVVAVAFRPCSRAPVIAVYGAQPASQPLRRCTASSGCAIRRARNTALSLHPGPVIPTAANLNSLENQSIYRRQRHIRLRCRGLATNAIDKDVLIAATYAVDKSQLVARSRSASGQTDAAALRQDVATKTSASRSR